MTEDQDPMLGDEPTQQAYKESVMRIMQETVQETRAARRLPTNQDNGEPVMLGNQGFAGGISSA